MNEVPVTLAALEGLNTDDPNYAVEVIDRLLPLAMSHRATDIHLVPRAQYLEILFRIDGVLALVHRLRRGASSDPVTRLMVLASLPTYRSGHPMEGRLDWPGKQSLASRGKRGVLTAKIESAGLEKISMRLGVFPSVHGPRAVVRLLQQENSFESLDALGMDPETSEQLHQLCQSGDGLILLSGPAGSGKTTTMYAMLRQIASTLPRRSVLTIEDPVESLIDGISQSEVDPTSGLTLAAALRSAVRQDCEVLLVSEIRDPETAQAALQASLTGHLVFSSLHATDVAAALRRLVQLGVPSYVIRSGVRAVLSQRLLRRRCGACEAQNREDCEACLGSGYRGRFAIGRCLRLDGSDPEGDALGGVLEQLGSVREMRAAAPSKSLWQAAQQAIDQGRTDEAEAYRLLGPRADSTLNR